MKTLSALEIAQMINIESDQMKTKAVEFGLNIEIDKRDENNYFVLGEKQGQVKKFIRNFIEPQYIMYKLVQSNGG